MIDVQYRQSESDGEISLTGGSDRSNGKRCLPSEKCLSSGKYNMHTHLLLWLFILNSLTALFLRFFKCRFFFNCSWRMSNGSIGQGILRSNKYYTDGEMT